MKMQEKALRLLFETRDASCVKKYLLSQWEKVSTYCIYGWCIVLLDVYYIVQIIVLWYDVV